MKRAATPAMAKAKAKPKSKAATGSSTRLSLGLFLSLSLSCDLDLLFIRCVGRPYACGVGQEANACHDGSTYCADPDCSICEAQARE